MYKHYIAVWSVDEELKRGNKYSLHNFIDTDGNKLMIASKLHRISDETVKKIWELIKAESEIEIRKPCINYEDGCERY